MKFQLLQSLRKLKKELDEGTINAEEYATQRQALLDEAEKVIETLDKDVNDETLYELLEDENTVSELLEDRDTVAEHLEEDNTVSDFLDEQNTGVHLLDASKDADTASTRDPEAQLERSVTQEMEIPHAEPSRKSMVIPVLIGLAVLTGLILWKA